MTASHEKEPKNVQKLRDSHWSDKQKQALVSARTITKIKCYKDGEVIVQLTCNSSL